MWVQRRGVQIWAGEPFPEPTRFELAPYRPTRGERFGPTQGRAEPEHGTESGYGRHRRLGEVACVPCRAAASQAVQRRKRARRAG